MEAKQRYPITKDSAVITNQAFGEQVLNNQADVNSKLASLIDELREDVDNQVVKVSDGLELHGDSIRVSLANEASNENFLKFEGDDQAKALAVRTIKTTAAVLANPIHVAGLSGTLGTGFYKNGATIPAGTSIEEILNKLLCQESYPSTKTTSGSMAVSMGAPSISATNSKTSQSIQNNGTVEAGTKIKFSQINTKTATATLNAHTVSGFSYGYSHENDNTVDYTSNTITGSTTLETQSDQYEITAKFSGFAENQETIVNSGTNGASIAPIELTVADNANKVQVSCTGTKFKGTAKGISSKYIVSNLGNTSEAKMSKAIVTSYFNGQGSSSASFTVNGTRYCFHGSTKAAIQTTSDAVRNQGFTKTTSKTFNVSVGDGDFFIYIIFPSSWGSLTSVINPLMNNSEIVGSFGSAQLIDVEGANGYKSIQYKMYKFEADAALSKNSLSVKIS